MNTKQNLIMKITSLLLVIFLTFGNVVQASAFFSSTVAETTRQVTVIEKDLDSSTEAPPQSNQLQGAYDWYVDAINGSDGNDGSEGSPFKTIQKAITIATAGQSVFVANGTYPEKLVIRKDIQITGESRDGTIIDTSSLIDYGVDADGDFITSFANLTLVGPGGLGYGFKINGDNAQTTLSNILVKDSYRTGIDLNGLNSAVVTDVVVENNGGNGFAMTNCSNVTITNITTSGNAWGGVALYTNSTVNTQGSDNVSIVGTNSFGEPTAFYTQIHPDYPPTNLNVPDFAYMVTNATDKPNVTILPQIWIWLVLLLLAWAILKTALSEKLQLRSLLLFQVCPSRQPSMLLTQVIRLSLSLARMWKRDKLLSIKALPSTVRVLQRRSSSPMAALVRVVTHVAGGWCKLAIA